MMEIERTEFGLKRSADCSCAECAAYCKHLPGYLVPEDLQRLAAAANQTEIAYAVEHLLASMGAVVAVNGELFNIPVLVPARQQNGSCKFLTSDNQCAIHTDAPFGCAFFDPHMNVKIGESRSALGLQSIAKAWRGEKPSRYALAWRLLKTMGLETPDRRWSRANLDAELAEVCK